MRKLNFLSRALNRWAFRHKIRVFVCGAGTSVCEWESLQSSFYTNMRPSIQRVFDVNEADVIALHGPISDCMINRLENLIESYALPVVAVGSELELDVLGFVMTSRGEPSQIRVMSQLLQHSPEPQDLQALISQVVHHV